MRDSDYDIGLPDQMLQTDECYIYNNKEDIIEDNLFEEDLTDEIKIEIEETEDRTEHTEEISHTWTEEDLEMLACGIYREGGGDKYSDDTRLKIGCVIMNRVDHWYYPDTLYDVLIQKSQYGRFYWTGIVWPKRASHQTEEHAVKRAYEIAERVLNGERILDPDYVYQAEFIQSDDYIKQDGLYFCRWGN